MTSIRKALLLFNPVSGAHLDTRAATVGRVAEVLRRGGVEVRVEATQARGSAGNQARAAIAEGCEAVIACGGDGTVFEILQGVAESNAVMGVIPLGTGNVLAHDLGLGGRPERAAELLLQFEPRRISLGRITAAGRSRFFTVAAGVGVHAELLYRANARAKQRGGFLTYYSQGARLLYRHKFIPFAVEIVTSDGRRMETTALELVAMRVRSFGGPLRHWQPGSSLLHDDLRLVLLRSPSRAHLMRYALQALTGMAAYEELDSEAATEMGFLSAQSVVCHPPDVRARMLRVQADGELLGPAPAEIAIVPSALTLLLPRGMEETAARDQAEAAGER